jgi:O-antigen ligase
MIFFIKKQKQWFDFIKNTAYFLSTYTWIGIFFAMPISRALFNTCIVLTVLLTLLSGNYLKKYKVIKSNPISLPFFILIIIILIGSIYTVGNQQNLLTSFYVYIKIAFMLLFLSIIDNIKLIRNAFIAFSMAMIITLISTYLNIWYVLPWSLSKTIGFGNSHHVFRDYIVQGLYTSFFTTLCGYFYLKINTSNNESCGVINNKFKFIFSKSSIIKSSIIKLFFIKLFIITLYILSCVSILYLLGSRTGYLAFFFSNTIFFSFLILDNHIIKQKRYFFIYAIALLVLLLLVLCSIYFSSELLQNRVNLVVLELSNYTINKTSSSGVRLYMWITAYNIFLQAPLFGHGTGSYPVLSEIAFNNKLICDIACPHPHNQFLLFAVEHGLIGLCTLLFIIWRFLKFSFSLHTPEKLLLLSFMAIFIVDCITHGALWLRMESYFFVYMFGLLMSYANFSKKLLRTCI